MYLNLVSSNYFNFAYLFETTRRKIVRETLLNFEAKLGYNDKLKIYKYHYNKL